VLRIGGATAAALGLGGVVAGTLREKARADQATVASGQEIRLVATDGYVNLPGRDPLYVFGFVEGDVNASISQVTTTYKGKVQAPAPILAINQGEDLYLTLTNVGLVVRPDLDDSHTVHWHGFRNPNAVFDGVPEVSIAVPVGRDFTYFFRPRDPGTYMYHCHFEDVEHVQMGMTGIVFIRPELGPDYVYNDMSTHFDREFALLLNEVDVRPHDNLESVQEFLWTDYKPNYFVINGRAWPDTKKENSDPGLPSQPISSLVTCNGGERVLLRLVNLGYEQHTMQLPGITMEVIGEDATFLNDGRAYMTNSIYIGPGEARDVMFWAPAFTSSWPTKSDARGTYNFYRLFNRNAYALSNDGSWNRGGMQTEVRVYQNPIELQNGPNDTGVAP
jgi:FtsP/CotA-like multicopper oxidase with cupredoxin domain